jgi:transposase
MIREMRDRGMKIGKIAEELGISRPTVRKYLKARKPPEYNKKKRVSKIDEYKPYIIDRIGKYDLSAVRILEEIGEKGYKGSYTTLKDYCRTVRRNRSITAVYRYETDPGKQAQVDFGEFGPHVGESWENHRDSRISMVRRRTVCRVHR